MPCACLWHTGWKSLKYTYTNIFQMKKLGCLPKEFAQSCTQINTERYLWGSNCFFEELPSQSQCLWISEDMRQQRAHGGIFLTRPLSMVARPLFTNKSMKTTHDDDIVTPLLHEAEWEECPIKNKNYPPVHCRPTGQCGNLCVLMTLKELPCSLWTQTLPPSTETC